MKITLLAAAAALFVVAPASAQIAVDGSLDAGYGNVKSTVAYNPTAPNSNFGAPTAESDAVAYSIYLTSDSQNVYGFFQADPSQGGAAAGAFANLYFDLNPPVMDGSDLGFEIGSGGITAFVPGRNGQPGFSTVLASSQYSVFASGNVVEFALSNSLFNQPIPGLIYYPNQTYPGDAGNGNDVVLRLSQSFGYSVAGGGSYGATRLGAVTVPSATGAVPEPATWAMMIAGFGLVGGAMRRRKTSVAFA